MKIVTPMRVGLSGRFCEIKARKKTGKERILSSGFSNLILDSGLDNGATEDVLDVCAVGNGTSQPEVSQSSLDSLVASTSTVSSISSEALFDEENDVYGGFKDLEYTFAEGQAEGNLSEIGIGWTGNDLFSRELIRDENGDPTTITVLSDEELVVTYRLFCLVGIDPDPWGPTLVAGQERSGDVLPARLNRSQWESTSRSAVSADTTAASQFRAGGSGLADVQDSVSGDSPSAGDISSLPASEGERFRDVEVLWGTGDANFGDGVNAFQFVFNGFIAGAFQMSVDPPIMKTSDDELTMVFRVTFDRGTVPD